MKLQPKIKQILTITAFLIGTVLLYTGMFFLTLQHAYGPLTSSLGGFISTISILTLISDTDVNN